MTSVELLRASPADSYLSDVCIPIRTRVSGPGKRCFDLAVALASLICLAPVLVVLAIAVKLTSPGPVIYKSPRLGVGGMEFKAWKFRTMCLDAEPHLADLLRSSPSARAEYESFRKLRNDPRVTPLGRFLRKMSLDELPQLINIVRGEMSVVGPRPKLLDETEIFGSSLAAILEVRPGLTGLWQVSGRSDLAVEERVELDLKYVSERRMRTDLAICFRTAYLLLKPGRNGAV